MSSSQTCQTKCLDSSSYRKNRDIFNVLLWIYGSEGLLNSFKWIFLQNREDNRLIAISTEITKSRNLKNISNKAAIHCTDEFYPSVENLIYEYINFSIKETDIEHRAVAIASKTQMWFIIYLFIYSFIT